MLVLLLQWQQQACLFSSLQKKHVFALAKEGVTSEEGA